MNKIIKGDDVIVLAGRDKGKRGTVLRILNNRQVLVDSVNVVKKHVRPNPNKGETGGIIQKEMPVAMSNVKVVCSSCGDAGRTGIRYLKDGGKERFWKKCGKGNATIAPPRAAPATE